MTNKFNDDWHLGHQTADGRKAVILQKDSNAEHDGIPQPIVAAVQIEGDKWSVLHFSRDGRYMRQPTITDLVNAPEPPRERTVYANVYSLDPSVASDTFMVHSTRAHADAVAVKSRLACIKITVREGQFDD